MLKFNEQELEELNFLSHVEIAEPATWATQVACGWFNGCDVCVAKSAAGGYFASTTINGHFHQSNSYHLSLLLRRMATLIVLGKFPSDRWLEIGF